MKKILLLLFCALLLTSCNSDKITTMESNIDQLGIELNDEKTKYAISIKELDEKVIDLQILETKNKSNELLISNLKEEISALQSSQNTSYKKEKEIQVISGDENYIQYIYVEDDNSYKNITIISDEQVEDLYEENLTRVQFGKSVGNSVSFTIIGKIYNVRFVHFEFNEDFSEKMILEVLNEEPVLENTIIDINSPVPEGIPFEMLEWEDKDGVTYSYLIQDNGRDNFGYIMLN